uniref:Ig-like domain-containing protein n=1 Tax=Malurus cyaneus samueli TaxID=2593467 RepID=A0A8C5U735_9PASS
RVGDDVALMRVGMAMEPAKIEHRQQLRTRVPYGEDFRADCKASGWPVPRLSWALRTGRGSAAPGRGFVAAALGGHHLLVRRAALLHPNGSLSIAQAGPPDAGQYVCAARNPGGADTKLYELRVAPKPPTINGLHGNRTVVKVTAVRHSKKHIECRAEGTPPPRIVWVVPDNIFLTAPYYGGRIAVHQNGTLEIRNVRPSDAAEFVCVARNEGGEAVLVVRLEVTEMLRRPTFKNPLNERIVAKPGRAVTLNCSVDGNPPPDVSWMLPNAPGFPAAPGHPGFPREATGPCASRAPRGRTPGGTAALRGTRWATSRSCWCWRWPRSPASSPDPQGC